LAAVIRVAGRDFDVDAFLAPSTLKPCAVHRRGERRFAGSSTNDRLHEKSGMNIVASDAGLDEFDRQATEATQFLECHADEIRRLASYPGVEAVTLDFGIAQRNVPAQSDYLPPELVRAAASLGLGIELSHHATLDEASE
jgi:hypothetical protein